VKKTAIKNNFMENDSERVLKIGQYFGLKLELEKFQFCNAEKSSMQCDMPTRAVSPK